LRWLRLVQEWLGAKLGWENFHFIRPKTNISTNNTGSSNKMTTSFFKAATSKHQLPKKLQAPSTKCNAAERQTWSLKLGASLELGSWGLELSSRQHEA
jgi:hypothetical protein